MTRSNALTKEQLNTTLQLIERMEQLGDNVSRMEVNFGEGPVGELVRDGAQITFAPAPAPRTSSPRRRAPRVKQDTYPYAN